jgi:ADP-heptose:LPS heptosyltransferase
MNAVSDALRPAVFFVNGFGDQLMSLPAMRALGAMFPDGMQVLIGEGLLSFMYRGLPIDRVARAFWADVTDRRVDVERTLEGTRGCDLFICLSPWFSPTILDLAERMGAERTVGAASTAFDVAIPLDSRAHMFDLLFSIPQGLQTDLSLDDFAAPPRFSPAAESAARRFVDEHVPPGYRMLFVHPETFTHKMWGHGALSWVLQRFLDSHPDFIVFVASVMFYPLSLTRHWDRIVLLDEHLELVLSILSHADLFLGVDSCCLHAADLFRIPGVALFGPTEPHRWGFRLSPRGRHVSGGGSMHTIERDAVLEALLELADGETGVPVAASARPLPQPVTLS